MYVDAYLRLQIYQSKQKEVVITQLGYSRNGTNACLPDELIEQIKEYVFYDITNDEIIDKFRTVVANKLLSKILYEPF